jgi:hypothetical protein
MHRLVQSLVLFLTVAAALPASGGITGATADGAWDCKDDAGAFIGTVVVADTSYAFIAPDGKVGEYGKLHQVGEADFDLPHFVVLGGDLKDVVGASGLGLTGPKGNNHDLSGELFLIVIIADGNTPYCRRRVAAAS